MASGDPDHKSIVLWTRVTPSGQPPNVVNVKWVVSEKANLKKPVASGTFITHEGRDYTVKLLAKGLKSQTRYYYGFTAGGKASPVGR